VHCFDASGTRSEVLDCPRIAKQITLAFGVDIDKDAVRRILAMHFRPESGTSSPSWLTFLGHMKDSLCSADLFNFTANPSCYERNG
jgi:hypothetical protein